MTRTLDKRRPFGTIFPAFDGALYEQDGAYFDGSGSFLREDRPAPEPERVISHVTTTDADGNETVEEVETIVEVAVDPRMALIAWLKGEHPDPQPKFMTVRGWGQDVLGKVSRTKEDLLSDCVDAGLVSAEQVKA